MSARPSGKSTIRDLTRLAAILAVAFAASAGFAEEPTSSCPNSAALPLGLVAEQPAEGRFVKTGRGYMVPYTATIPGTDVTFEMVPVPGGKFRIGSPEDEKGRLPEEGPRFTVRVEPFWMGKHEVTWAEYRPYMDTYNLYVKLSAEGENHPRMAKSFDDADAVTTPTPLWEPGFNFQHGEDPRLPAATMTQFAARQYTKWVSGLTGEFHRLPTEAEWEYAGRAGTSTMYSFGDDPNLLDEHAWHDGNSGEKTHRVGQKKPNPWGLHDIHGNVMEWVLDQYDPESYGRFDGKEVATLDAVSWPTKWEPRTLRGGSYYGLANEHRSARRFESADSDWQTHDPNSPPQSAWWYTNEEALEVGFRIIRPLDPPTGEARARFHEPDFKDLYRIVQARWAAKGGGLLKVDKAFAEFLKGTAAKTD
ncbi:MAG: formylglycine-generating enzyme family protein [Planctomycetaceae bacterium]